MKKILKWGGIIFIGLIVLGVIGSILGGGKSTTSSNTGPSSNNQQAQQIQPTATPAPMVVDATTLVGEYDKNKLSAQDKYTGKIVQTTAFINNISSDVLGSYYLSLNPSSDQYYFGTSIQCYFKDKSALTSLSKGQSVTVNGTMQDMSLGIVEMKDCSLIK